jgi:hypothetical protein
MYWVSICPRPKNKDFVSILLPIGYYTTFQTTQICHVYTIYYELIYYSWFTNFREFRGQYQTTILQTCSFSIFQLHCTKSLFFGRGHILTQYMHSFCLYYISGAVVWFISEIYNWPIKTERGIWVLRFPPPIKLTATIYLKYCWKWH